jgi:hypothetical protein
LRRRKPSLLGEEERAAILLMALSSGVIYALLDGSLVVCMVESIFGCLQ